MKLVDVVGLSPTVERRESSNLSFHTKLRGNMPKVQCNDCGFIFMVPETPYKSTLYGDNIYLDDECPQCDSQELSENISKLVFKDV